MESNFNITFAVLTVAYLYKWLKYNFCPHVNFILVQMIPCHPYEGHKCNAPDEVEYILLGDEFDGTTKKTT